jgi:hydroxylamine reductase (hybrid-cluster protein)
MEPKRPIQLTFITPLQTSNIIKDKQNKALQDSIRDIIKEVIKTEAVQKLIIWNFTTYERKLWRKLKIQGRGQKQYHKDRKMNTWTGSKQKPVSVLAQSVRGQRKQKQR